MALLDFITHPAFLDIVFILIIAFSNGFTGPYSPARLWIGLPLVTVLTFHLVTTSVERTGSRTQGGAFGSPAIGLWLQFVDTSLIGRWHVEAGGPRNTPKRKKIIADSYDSSIPIWSRFVFGLQSAVDLRGTNTHYESAGIAPFSSRDPTWVPSKSRFLAKTLFEILAAYGLVVWLGTLPSFAELADRLGTSHEVDLVGHLSDVTMTELFVRLFFTLKQYAQVACGFYLFQGIIAFPAVALGMNPAGFRPLFGSPLEAYTIRRFWSPFWHQVWRRRFTSIASVLTFGLFQLRRGSISARYTMLFFVFLTSGLTHLGDQIAEGEPWRHTGALVHFVSQAFVIMLEDYVAWLFNLRSGSPSLPMKLLGYVWVLFVLAVTGPYWVHPAMDRGSRAD